ncbi:MAG: dTDP-6-deoxy-L-hexose 3-O-methyltransferase [Candidatus Doudnabacteria bacterium RIFCSPHIGHO2_01_FULL_49_9]|uniref:dTDP-6-deoxy-L-hexose 3-O-methyltransferase n=1 Tax=Candidatus Doudnabacteria bacterium RIFCSPHIGHO2_01_FULL_49_9 TaxID=1817827 RepID=A0A1F5NY88_9BACT|nr:MAG: dTDP-6-deoxy-L-hexose 3-O-methyltransferase [Candidatus Doudnabacteria bacterium RIFCSPHIGHO2_01_FULL_49_9]
MIKLPDFTKAFEYENNFYLSCDNTRLSKILAHYELFKMAKDLPGAMIECGVLKGASFVRFAGLRDLFANSFSHKLIGFDIFGAFPETNFEEDKKYRNNVVQNGGEQSISKEQLIEVLRRKGVEKNVELVEGDVVETIPEYLKNNPHLKISLLNLDTDIYEPAVAILEHLWPRIVRGGVLMLDDYGTFPGETKAVDDYFKDKDVKILKFNFAMTPCYIVKK